MARGRRGHHKRPVSSDNGDNPTNTVGATPTEDGEKRSTVVPHKRQKRAEYRDKHAHAHAHALGSKNKDPRSSVDVNAGDDEGGMTLGDGEGKGMDQLGDAGMMELPKKKFYRQRAHANPFSDHQLEYPRAPWEMDWREHFPAFVGLEGNEDGDDVEHKRKRRRLNRDIEVADVGCGFGGLLFGLAPKMPDTLMLGLEIRMSVTEFVQNKIRALRQQSSSSQPNARSKASGPQLSQASIPGGYQNISALRANTMKFLPNLFPKHSLLHLFLCFPDPHFKARKHKARIVSPTLNSEYAFVLKPGIGMVYTITDVEDLHLWMVKHFDGHASFERVLLYQRKEEAKPESKTTGLQQTHESEAKSATPQEQELQKTESDEVDALTGDPNVALMMKTMLADTEEAKKVSRHGGRKFVAVWRRIVDPPWPSA